MMFAKTQKTLEPRSETCKRIAWAYAAILVAMAVLQLYAFEDFIPLIQSYDLPGGDGTAALVASLIVVFEVFALPFLLRMPLSVLMRWFSLVCALAAASTWLKLSLYAAISQVGTIPSGIFGSKIDIDTGIPLLAISTGMVILAVVSVYGLWPARKK